MHSDETLISGCKRGDRKIQKYLYERFSPEMLVIGMRYCKSRAEAEDILQDAFVKVFKAIKDFRGDSSLFYWIKRIVINTALNHQRKKLYLFPVVDVEDVNLDVQPVQNLSFQELLSLIQSLPDGCQVIFNLYAIEGYSHKEIAEQLGVSTSTSKSQYFRAKKLLQEKLAALEYRENEKVR